MKPIYFIIWLLLAVFSAMNSQGQTTYKFTYDDKGNRESRTVISLKSTIFQPDSLYSEQNSEMLDEQIGLQKVLIYPNPTKGVVTIEFPSLNNQDAIIRVFDSQGKQLIHQDTFESNDQVDLSAYPSGFYYLIITLGQDRKEWKIIKE